VNSFELDGILEKKDVIRYTLASVPILDLTIRHMSVVQEAGSDRKLSFSAEAAVGPAAKALNEVELGSRLKFRGFLTTSSARSRKLVLHITEFEKE
jgi:primosomal replication protein N